MLSGAVDDWGPRIRTRSARPPTPSGLGRSPRHLGQLHARCPHPWTGPLDILGTLGPCHVLSHRCTAPAPVLAGASVSPERERLPPGRPTLTPTQADPLPVTPMARVCTRVCDHLVGVLLCHAAVSSPGDIFACAHGPVPSVPCVPGTWGASVNICEVKQSGPRSG